MQCTKISLETVRKRRLHKIAKNWLHLLSVKCPHWLNPPLFVRTHHKYLKFFLPKSADDRISRTPLFAKCQHKTPTSPLEYERLLWETLTCNAVRKFFWTKIKGHFCSYFLTEVFRLDSRMIFLLRPAEILLKKVSPIIMHLILLYFACLVFLQLWINTELLTSCIKSKIYSKCANISLSNVHSDFRASAYSQETSSLQVLP